MNSMDIQEALSEIDDKMVDDAAPAGKGRMLLYRFKTAYLTKRRFRALTAAAAVLAVVLLVNLVSGGIRGMNVKAYAVETAVYPETQDPESNSPEAKEYFKKKLEARGAVMGSESFFAQMNKQILGTDTTGNKVYSPFAVYLELAMLAEVTDGSSRQEILDALGADSLEALRQQAADMLLCNYGERNNSRTVPALSLWMNEDISYEPETLRILAEDHSASSFQGKMGSSEYAETMKAWINEATDGLLKDSVDGLNMSSEDVMHMISALYYHGRWNDRFSKDDNTEDIFYAPAGEITATYMHETMEHGTIFVGEHFMATGKGLEDGSTMWLILPDEGVSPEELLADREYMDFNVYMMSLYNTRYADNGAEMPEWENSRYIRINLSMPKFDITTSGSLKEGLMALGIRSCFDMTDSDFTPLTPDTDVFVSDAVQGARLAADEEGVTAAAYVDLMLAGAAMPPEDEMDLVIDRPFITMLTSSDGIPLYTGIVNEP